MKILLNNRNTISAAMTLKCPELCQLGWTHRGLYIDITVITDLVEIVFHSVMWRWAMGKAACHIIRTSETIWSLSPEGNLMETAWKFGFVFRISYTTVYPKKYAHGFCFAVLCCGYTLTDFPISIRLTSLALWQSNDCPSASKATLMNMDKYFMWIHYERLHNHNKTKHNKTVCIFLGIYCSLGIWAWVSNNIS